MNSIFRSSIGNSKAAFEPFIHGHGYSTSILFSQYTEEIQSSAVTSNGFLWQQALAQITYDNPFTIAQNEPAKNKMPHTEKNDALIQLLRSWREGDEQEQRNTWEYLKQALDEDRLSERKLFP